MSVVGKNRVWKCNSFSLLEIYPYELQYVNFCELDEGVMREFEEKPSNTERLFNISLVKTNPFIFFFLFFFMYLIFFFFNDI